MIYSCQDMLCTCDKCPVKDCCNHRPKKVDAEDIVGVLTIVSMTLIGVVALIFG